MHQVQDRFPGLGTTIEGSLVIDEIAGQKLWQEIRLRVAAFEKRFSRFRKNSELSQLNAQAGRPVRVSADMLKMIAVAQDMWNWTAGTVDPLIGGDLVAAGYRRSFTEPHDELELPRINNLEAVFGDIQWSEDGIVTLPAGSMLDFGGLGKGFLADDLGAFIRQTTPDFWLSLGGDIFVSGLNVDRQPWPIMIQDQRDLSRDYLQLSFPQDTYGIATSSTQARRGLEHGKAWHHIIDPHTNVPAQTDLLGVTVIAPNALLADVAAKTVVIRKQQFGLEWLNAQQGYSGVFFPAGGDPFTSPSLLQFTKPA